MMACPGGLGGEEGPAYVIGQYDAVGMGGGAKR